MNWSLETRETILKRVKLYVGFRIKPHPGGARCASPASARSARHHYVRPFRGARSVSLSHTDSHLLSYAAPFIFAARSEWAYRTLHTTRSFRERMWQLFRPVAESGSTAGIL